jgi:molybdopterin synthase catalytic subunit
LKGGAVRIQRADFSADAAVDRMLSENVGGTVIFVGTARGSSAEGKVPFLDFQAYGPMARRALEQIRKRALERFGVEEITVIHRTGRIRAGERIVLVAVSAPHRDAAFRACRYVLEELKKGVPIWKRERGIWSCTGLPAPRTKAKRGPNPRGR